MASSSSSSSPERTHSRQYTYQNTAPFKYANQADVLEDLSSRFILNLPDEELASVERICMQVEQAHWYYEDFIREENPKFPSLPLKKFSEMLFNSCPLLQRWSHDHEQAYLNFMQYKTRVPVCGAIMLNDKWDKCVLVKGWKSSSGWGFPKGKINQDEPTHSCAIREVSEETGYDLTQQLKPDDFIEMSIKDQRITLYIVGGVPEDYNFQTKTRKEISKIEWFNLADLPTWRRNKQVSGKFYLISPFVPPLKEFIRANKPRRKQTKQQSKVKSSVDRPVQMDGDRTTDFDDSLQDSFSSIHYDRDAQGSSSSSADNELQTPSPLSIEALPVTESGPEIDKGEQGFGDAHFARLLSSLTLSAKEVPYDVPSSSSPAASSTPTPADSPVKESHSSSPPLSTASSFDVGSQGTDRTLQQSSASPPSNISSSLSPKPSDVQSNLQAAVAPEMVKQSPASDPARRMKHLALLESVASESMGTPYPSMNFGQPTQSNIGTSRPSFTPLPHHPSSVPPPFAPLDQRFLGNNIVPGRQPVPPQGFGNFVNPHVQLPNYSDPIHGRPLTSNAILPPPLAQRRLMHHGSTMSLHQGNLLSILGTNGPTNAHPQSFDNSHVVAGNAMPHQAALPGVLQQPMRTNGMNGLVVVPPPMRSVQNGPRTAPLLAPQYQQQPMTNIHPNGLRHAPSNKAQLLSLLTPQGAVRPVAHPVGYPAAGM